MSQQHAFAHSSVASHHSLPLLLTLEQAAAFVGFAPETVRKWTYSKTTGRTAPTGWPEPIKIGGKAIRWRRSDLENWVSGLRQEGSENEDLNSPKSKRRPGRPRKVPLEERA